MHVCMYVCMYELRAYHSEGQGIYNVHVLNEIDEHGCAQHCGQKDQHDHDVYKDILQVAQLGLALE